jgi:tetratricopeptide (TPR) repeat protein
MKRVIAAALLLLVGVIVAYGFAMTRRERLYRQHVLRGDYALARGDTFTAVAAFGDAISIKPDSMLGHLKRGEARLRRGELDAAAADLATASALDPSAIRPHELRGDVDAARLRHDEAAEQYAACVRLDDRSPRVLYKLGLARYFGGRYREAALPRRITFTAWRCES